MPIHANLWDAIEVLDRFVVVTTGPDVSREWCRAGAVAKETGPHQEAPCWHCTPFMRAGTCEHTHAALLQPMEEAALPQRKPHAPFGGTYARRGTVRLTCGGGDTPRARCGPNRSISAPAPGRERTRWGPPRGETSARAWLRRLCRHFCKCGRGVERSLFMVDGGRCVSSRSARRGGFKTAGRTEATGTDRRSARSSTALATQHHALATVNVDNPPTAQRLTSGSVPRQQDLYAGPAPGTGHSLLAENNAGTL